MWSFLKVATCYLKQDWHFSWGHCGLKSWFWSRWHFRDIGFLLHMNEYCRRQIQHIDGSNKLLQNIHLLVYFIWLIFRSTQSSIKCFILLFIEEISAVHQNQINIIGACVLSIKKGARGKGRHIFRRLQSAVGAAENHIFLFLLFSMCNTGHFFAKWTTFWFRFILAHLNKCSYIDLHF